MRFLLALLLALVACHHEPQPMHPQPGDLPPLPPASGTPIGYLIDASGDLKLRDDQVKHLKEIDDSLAARDAEIDTQLRQIEKPEEEEEEAPKGQKDHKHPHRNNAPGANVPRSSDANKLHEMRNANDRDALKRAWAILEPAQQEAAKKILEDHGVEVPGAPKKQAGPNPEDGQPMPGMEP